MARSERIDLEVTRNGRYVATITARPEDAAEALGNWLAEQRYDSALWDQFRVRVPSGFGKREVMAA